MKYVIIILLTLACTAQTPEEVGTGGFCGTSTLSPCESDFECSVGGCSGQICGDSSAITTCEFKECYDDITYNVTCSCVQNECRWN